MRKGGWGKQVSSVERLASIVRRSSGSLGCLLVTRSSFCLAITRAGLRVEAVSCAVCRDCPKWEFTSSVRCFRHPPPVRGEAARVGNDGWSVGVSFYTTRMYILDLFVRATCRVSFPFAESSYVMLEATASAVALKVNGKAWVLRIRGEASRGHLRELPGSPRCSIRVSSSGEVNATLREINLRYLARCGVHCACKDITGCQHRGKGPTGTLRRHW